MRWFLIIWLAAIVVAVSAWTKEDHEIFDLVSAVEAAEGKDTTFYSWLDISTTASTAEISKAYRRKSIQLHPDKNPGLKNANERFARLGVVAAILRDSEGRKRYDFFYKNGVPRWRGTGYYYSRFRPGLGTVVIFLVILSSVLQYIVQRMNYKRDLQRIEWIIDQAKSAAWGNKMLPGEGQRKVKVNLGGGPRLDEDGNVVAGKMVDMIVEGNDVYILEPDGSMLPLDSESTTPPELRQTWFVASLIGTWHMVVPSKAETSAAEEMEDGSATESVGSGTKEGQEGVKSGRAPAVKAGGKRRKNVRKR